MTKMLYLNKSVCKNCYICNKKVCIQNMFRLTHATNTYKHISRHIRTTITASRKLAHDKVFLKRFSQKGL